MRVKLAAAIALAAAPALARPRAPKNVPEADALLERAFSFPEAGCAARGRIQFFRRDEKPKGLGTAVYTLPDGRLRREIHPKGPSKPAALVIVDDGREQTLYIPKPDRFWTGRMERESAADALARLKAIYEISVSTGGRVAKRRTWRLDFRAPDGPLRRSFWVDRESGLLLKTETYRYDGAVARRERLLRLETPAAVEPGLFALAASSGAAAKPLIPPDRLVSFGVPVRFPRWSPLGFLALDARGANRGASIFYSDGAASYAVFEGPADADSGLNEKLGRVVRLKDGSSARLLPAGDGAALVRRSAAGALFVVGDLADEELVRVAESVEGGR
jgi:hypothetical protein